MAQFIQKEPENYEVKPQSKHRLFIEGETEEAFDHLVLKELLKTQNNTPLKIRLEPLGPALNVKQAAVALAPSHPYYYFLIDRDHQRDEEVENCWRNFPQQGNNLLIWRKKELENYFLEPTYLLKSNFLKKEIEEDRIRQIILTIAKERVFLEIANRVIIEIRENLKNQWIKIFNNVADFSTKDEAKQHLLNLPNFREKANNVYNNLSQGNIEELFDSLLTDYLGGRSEPQFGCGNWLSKMSGKKILPQLINKCFEVEDKNGNTIQEHKEKTKYIVKDLLKQELIDQPHDFKQLHELIKARVETG